MQAIRLLTMIRHTMFVLFLALIALLMKADRWTANANAANVFTNECGQWAQGQKQTASDGGQDNYFGSIVSISGDTVVVGAWQKNSHTGAVYVFGRNKGGADNWGQVQKLTPSPGESGGRFGFSVKINGDTIVVGAPFDDSFTGAAYVYGRNQGGADNWGLIRKLLGKSGEIDHFGASVGVSGDTVVVGAFSSNSLTGAAYVFGRNQGGAGNWGQIRKLIASDGERGDSFGSRVDVSGDTVVVGANAKNSYTGAAYIYQRNQGGADNWGQIRKLTASDGLEDDSFGDSLAISGNVIVVGERGGNNTLIGGAYVFERNQGGPDNWGQVRKLIVRDATGDNRFISSVGISGDTVVVGAHLRFRDTNSAYVFRRNQGGANNWGQVQALTSSETGTSDAFGVSVGISDDTLVVGAPGKNLGTGVTYIFRTVCPPIISKAFGATNIMLNGTTSLSFTLNNPDASHAVSGLAFSDPLPAGLIVATPANVTGSCGGTVSAVAGSSTISLSGGALAAGGACTISVNVTGTTVGSKVNTTGPLMTSNGAVAPSNTAVLNVHDLRASLGDPLICTGAGGLVSVTATVTNGAATAQAASFTANLPASLLAVPGTCTANVGTCAVTNSSTVTWMDTLAAGQTVTITYQAQIADDAIPGSQVCVTSTATVGGSPAGSVTACTTLNCPPSGPGLPLAAASPMSDQKAGSVLIYNVYTSSIDPMRQNTRLSITNTEPTRPAFVHLFFVDGASCSVADTFLCLTPNQTVTFLASDLDPGTTGYAVAVATDAAGCPVNFNYLIGDEYVKFQSGHAANLGAQAISAIAGGLPVCGTNSSTAVLAFDGVSYNPLPHVLAADNLPSRADGNDTMLIVNRIGGNLGTGAGTLGTLFGLFYDDQETSVSFQFTPGTCQFRSLISNAFPRITPRFEQFVPAGRSGWFKLWEPGLFGISGALINFNANATSNAGAFNQGHNLHVLTNTNTASYVVPVFPPNC